MGGQPERAFVVSIVRDERLSLGSLIAARKGDAGDSGDA